MEKQTARKRAKRCGCIFIAGQPFTRIIEIIIHENHDIYMRVMSILILDYAEAIDMPIVLNYTENNEMIPERTAPPKAARSSRRRNCHRLREKSFKAAIEAAFFVQRRSECRISRRRSLSGEAKRQGAKGP